MTPLVEQFGARAQLLAPILSEGALIGVLSVHSGQVRAWSAVEIAAAEQAAAGAHVAPLDLVATPGPAREPPRGT